jgi:hypothetical protein
LEQPNLPATDSNNSTALYKCHECHTGEVWAYASGLCQPCWGQRIEFSLSRSKLLALEHHFLHLVYPADTCPCMDCHIIRQLLNWQEPS